MKLKALLLTLLLLSSQAHAWGKREQSALLGFIGGVLVSSAYNQNHHQQQHKIQQTNDSTIYYEAYTQPVKKIRIKPRPQVKKVVVQEVHHHYYYYR